MPTILIRLFEMGNKNSRKLKKPIFESIRKPTAPSSKKFGHDRPEEKIHPTRRKVKYKGKKGEYENDDL